MSVAVAYILGVATPVILTGGLVLVLTLGTELHRRRHRRRGTEHHR